MVSKNEWGGEMEQNKLWESILNEIYPEVNSASFHAWFHDLKLIKIQVRLKQY